jgi:hypothetical protein
MTVGPSLPNLQAYVLCIPKLRGYGHAVPLAPCGDKRRGSTHPLALQASKMTPMAVSVASTPLMAASYTPVCPTCRGPTHRGGPAGPSVMWSYVVTFKERCAVMGSRTSQRGAKHIPSHLMRRVRHAVRHTAKLMPVAPGHRSGGGETGPRYASTRQPTKDILY